MSEFKIVTSFENYLINIQTAKEEWKYGYLDRIKIPTIEEEYDLTRKNIMFPIGIIKSAADISYLKEKKYFSSFPIVYNSTMITVDSLEGKAQDKNPLEMPTSEEADTWIEGDEVLYINPGLENPIRYPKDMYIKYFWLFYIVAVDFWEKYPQHVYVGNKPFNAHKDLATLHRLATYKSRFFAAVSEAKRNLPWAQEAEKMVEEKKKEGTYWSELAKVAEECDRLERETKLQQKRNILQRIFGVNKVSNT